MRARYLAERKPLLETGVRDVVAEEVEGAVEIMARLLRWLEVPRNDIESRVREARVETQSSERKLTLPRPSLPEFRALDDLKVDSVRMEEGWPSIGQSAASLGLRTQTGALVVAVRRGEKLLEHPDPTVPFETGDIVYFVGSSGAVRKAMELLARPSA
jgi:CPA2 family monovalent cation:H+ antiporter-2